MKAGLTASTEGGVQPPGRRVGLRSIEEQMAGRRVTPMLEQFVAAKRACPAEAILLFRMGDFFEFFLDDAELASHELGINLTSRDKGKRDPIPMAGVPHHAVHSYVQRLVDKGFTVAICDQVEDPKLAKGIVKREVTRLVTPGTISDLEALDPCKANYVAHVVPSEDSALLLVLLDMLSGELLLTVCPAVLVSGSARTDPSAAADELRRMGAREVLVNAGDLAETFRAEEQGLDFALRILASEELPNPKDQRHRFVERFPGGAGVAEGIDFAALAAGLAVPAGGESVAAAVDTLIGYVEQTQRRRLQHLSPPRAYRRSDTMVVDEATRRNLELVRCMDGQRRGSLLWHLDRCCTAQGSRTLARWILFPLRDLPAILARQGDVAALRDDRRCREQARELLRAVRDIERLVGRVAVGRATPRDLALLRTSLVVVPDLAALLSPLPSAMGDAWQPFLSPTATPGQTTAEAAGAAQGTADLADITDLLQRALLDEPPAHTADGGYMAQGYDAQLDKVLLLCSEGHEYLFALEKRERQRTGISSLKVRYNKVFGYYVEVSKAHSNRVPADYERKQTLVNAERFVIAELKQYEQAVLSADERRRRLEQGLFRTLVASVTAAIPRLRRLSRVLARTDVLLSLAQVADEDNLEYIRPTLCTEPVVQLVQARHPVIERLMPGGERFVPNDVDLDARSRQLLLVTGPNMAGKSTVMRQVALCTMMAHIGAFVPARAARVGLCDRLFTRVGASDNLGGGQSTFMVEMVETATILRQATSHSLVILDEVGRGTSTYDGVSIAWAVAEHLHNISGCRTMFATHYHELTALASKCDRVVNVSLAVQETGDGVAFLRRLVEGKASRSYGIEVAKLAGLPEAVLRRAQNMLATMEHHAPRPGVGGSQLRLFSPPSPKPPVPPSPSPVLSALRGVDVSAMTPLQALNTLDQLQTLLHQQEKEAEV